MRYSLSETNQVEIEVINPLEIAKNPILLDITLKLFNQLDKAQITYYKPFGIPWNTWSKEDLLKWLPKYHKFYFLKETTSEKVVGLVALMKSMYPNTYLCREIVIDRLYRGKGLGRYLLSNVISTNKPSRLCLQCSEPNQAGIRLYESLGFRTASRFMITK